MADEGSDPGGGGGLAVLFEQLRPQLLRFLAARCGDPEEAQDVIQELWIKLADTRIGPVANGKAYLFKMANNLVLDRRRARQRAMARDAGWIDASGLARADDYDAPDPDQLADATLIEKEEQRLLHEAIAALPPGARRALLLYRFEQRKQDEIARIMQISRSGVEKHLALAMKKLREALRDCGIGGGAASGKQGQMRGTARHQDR